MKRVAALIAVCLFSSFIGLAVGQTMILGKPDIGHHVFQVRFDESQQPRATPTIPKAWRFVGVSNGEKVNMNNLWFQDQAGNIYLVRGFNTGTEFVLLNDVHKLAVGD